MKKSDLAYTAGIVDGEGWIGILLNKSKGRKPYYLMRVVVANTNEWLIQWLKFGFGGYAYCRQSKANNTEPIWEWIITANKALEFLKLIYPYLHLKKPQAEIAIKFQGSRRGVGHRLNEKERAVTEAQRIIMSGLNKKGQEMLI